jgi:hypothetical protein
MAQIALFIGVKDGVREIIDQGDPRDMRIKFKTSPDGLGFDTLEVFESTVGRSRRRSFLAKAEKVSPEESDPPVIDDEPEADDPAPADEIDISDLIEQAQGDGRKQETKDARRKLDEMGVEY